MRAPMPRRASVSCPSPTARGCATWSNTLQRRSSRSSVSSSRKSAITPKRRASCRAFCTISALAAKMIANKVRSAGLADILGATDNENVQGEIQQKLDILANEIIVKAMDHGGRLCAMASEEEPGHHSNSRAVQVRQVLPAVRSARRLVEHRRQRARRHDLLRRPQDHARPARRARRHAAAGPPSGRGGLRDLRLEHDARVHHGPGRARLHARSVDRRVPALAPEHPHSGRRALSVGQRFLRAAVGRGRAQDHAAPFEGSRRTTRRSARATSARSSPTSTATCSAAASSRIRRTRNRRRESCGCSTRPIRSRSSSSRRAAPRPTASQRVLDVTPTELHQRTPLYIGSASEVELARRTLTQAGELVSA